MTLQYIYRNILPSKDSKVPGGEQYTVQLGTDWFSNGKPRMDGSHLVVPPLGDNEDHPDRLCSGWIWKRGVFFTTIPGKLI